MGSIILINPTPEPGHPFSRSPHNSMGSIVKYMKEVTGKTGWFDAFKASGIYGLVDGKVAETILVHGPTGKLVGSDHLGNHYYERTEDTQYGRHRWVVYKDKRAVHYNASSVPAEWHGWLHYINDEPPTLVAPHYPVFHVPHTPSKTMSDERYLPKGSWVKASEKRNWKKFEAWSPHSS